MALYNPFRSIHRGVVVTVICTYFLLLTSQMSWPLLSGQGYVYQSFWTACNWELEYVIPVESSWYLFFVYMFFPVEFLLPAVPIIASCIGTIWLLSNNATNNSTNNSNIRCGRKTKATVTVILITLVYIACSAPYWVVIIIYMSQGGQHSSLVAWLEGDGQYAHILITPISVVINAGVNPLVYYFRIDEIRHLSLTARFHTRRKRTVTVEHFHVRTELARMLSPPKRVRRACRVNSTVFKQPGRECKVGNVTSEQRNCDVGGVVLEVERVSFGGPEVVKCKRISVL